ncbi:asparagine synthase (glutamine-hydrolyzing) [Prochlorococcus marinus str. MU1402]|uniref:asparagine synthase (glutamine-hydrolyzing) n=1 Tax=Prochlorococcus marinus TaxID=1219 RepID=UPI001ADB7B37|nr:asparagine synthase (glutamine-hydrolyzing) [Prochlorococcus marinus]MBO8232410.1 asparagine synthase (glutamine-hydrolyzing) [Prochlorococcus marinus XMU1402]MBW3057138.1 asparagine synthase (glutamine-hydrolyzing) [Prochlorococcus marinus str. MU1402]
MCGIGGYWSPKNGSDENIAKLLLQPLMDRGPDYQGYWIEKTIGLALCHSRLAIIDTSNKGIQPMHSYNNRYVICFNGEIYNHKTIRKNLDKYGYKYKWNSDTDTETILAAIQFWGVEKAITKLDGMFAFCLWDKKEKYLYLVRDRIGEKPLYYYINKNLFIFGSEIRVLKKHPLIMNEINYENISEYFDYGFISGENTIYKNIKKVKPGSFVKLSYDCLFIHEKKIYWSLSKIINNNFNTFEGTKKEAKKELEIHLKKIINRQMVADVPLGAFLSGGIDSSCVVSIMQSISKNKINTFTLGFEDHNYDESGKAKRLANYLGTNHHELIVSEKDIQELIPKISTMFDGPFGDSSQFPTYLISKFAKKYVTVALSGDGGDELFSGYSRYYRIKNLYKYINKIPKYSIYLIDVINSVKNKINNQDSFSYTNKLKKLIKSESALNFYDEYMNIFCGNSIINPELSREYGINRNEDNFIKNKNIIDAAMYSDTINYLPDDILTKVDRMAMRSSLETRIPLIDHHLIEFSWSLPRSLIHEKNNPKNLLKEVLNNYIPKELINDEKKGFSIPMKDWLKGQLKDWAMELLNKSNLKKYDILDYKKVSSLWSEHLEGKRDWSNKIWVILMFQSWLSNEKLNG